MTLRLGWSALAVILLPALSAAQEFGSAPKVKFKRSQAAVEMEARRKSSAGCAVLAPVPLKDKTADYLKGLMAPFMKGYPGSWTLQYGDFGTGLPADSRPPREMGNDTDSHIFRACALIFDKRLTHENESEVRCVLAHEAAHAVLGHTQARKPAWEKSYKQCLTSEARAAVDKRIKDEFGGCSKSRMVGSQTECDALTDALIKDCAYGNPEYKALRERQETQADVAMTASVDGGSRSAGWACWSLMSTLPQAPKKSDDLNFHPPAKQRARSVYDYMASLGAKPPCGVERGD